MARIQQVTTESGEVRYRAIIRLGGFPPQSQTFRRRTDAKHWVTNCESDLRNRRHFGSQESKRHTAADMIERYLHEGFQHKPRSFKKPGPAVGRR